MKFYKYLYNLRFEIYLTVQLTLLFGALLFPHNFFEFILTPILYSLSILAGTLMISKYKKAMWFCIVLFIISLAFFGTSIFSRQQNIDKYILLRLGVYFIFNIIVTWYIIKQVWQVKSVDRKVILGLISGYISLGFLGFFLFMSIALTHTGAFNGVFVDGNSNFEFRADSILYFSFITLLTIGYGEISPAIPIAQKAAILVGLIGQFYIVIITAVVLEKYIRYSSKQEE